MERNNEVNLLFRQKSLDKQRLRLLWRHRRDPKRAGDDSLERFPRFGRIGHQIPFLHGQRNQIGAFDCRPCWTRTRSPDEPAQLIFQKSSSSKTAHEVGKEVAL